MAETVRAPRLAHVEALVNVVRPANVLADVEALADRDQRRRVLHVVGQLAHVAREPHNHPVAVARVLVVDDLGPVILQRLPDAGDRGLGAAVVTDAIAVTGARAVLVLLLDKKSQPQLALARFLVERKTGRIRTPVLAAVQHVDQRPTRRQTRLPMLEHHARYPAHARRPAQCPQWTAIIP